MWFLRAFVVLTVLQWSVVTGEGRTDQFTLSLCRVWEECGRTAAVDDLAHADLGTPQAICSDFAEMLEKHGVDCEYLLPADGADTDDGLSHDDRQPDNPDVPPSAKKLGRTNYFDDCSDIHTAYATFVGHVPSGVNNIKPVNVDNPISVYCDQTTDGGGWTVIQRRFDGSLEFYRSIMAYRDGFGDSGGEYWLGLDNIHRITAQNDYELYIELEDWDGNVKFARYSTFSVGVGNDYTVSIGGYSGTAGDGFGLDEPDINSHNINGANFYARLSHYTFRNVEWYGGGWWYKHDTLSNLNGPYFRDTDGLDVENNGFGVRWFTFNSRIWYSLKKTKMMVRPTDFSTRVTNRKLGNY